MADGSKPPKGQVAEELIIVRRVQPDDAGAKGGAWKIAYADFVTAMMAFFLVMWLINAANEKTKAQVASYFNPIKLVDNTTSAKGIKTPGDRSANSSGQNGGDSKPADQSEEQKPDAEKAEAKPAEESKAEKPEEKKSEAEEKKKSEQHDKAAGEASEHIEAAREAALFEDPFKVLSQIAREAPGGSDGKSDKTMVISDNSLRGGGESEGQMTRDPFDPLAWKLVPPVAHEVPVEPPPEPGAGEKKKEQKPESQAEGSKHAEKEDPGSSKGAQDEGQSLSPAGRAAIKEAESIRASLSEELSALGTRHPDLDVKTTSEGVLISLTDSVSFDMFDVGSAKPRPVVVKLMEKVAAAVKDFNGKIIVRGHTDGRPYRGNGYDNWRLSMARAQMAYYMLIRAGVQDDKVERIEGYADKALIKRDQPESAENRRIEILLKVDKP